ncbi:MAG: hypothetical protein LBH35_06070, partial [Treponema sp.]|nr:hypothetical protein [Treponema sp.]
ESFWAEQYNVDDMTIPSVSLNWEDVYEDFFPYFGPVYFTNASIHITYTHFGIKTIVRNGEEFVVEAKNNGYMFETFTSTTPLNWEKINDKEMIRIIFVLDGDYMDVYLEDKDEKLCTLVNIETSFIDEYMKFIHNGKVNFGNLGKWPKRADGSMDYPPPQLTQAVPDEPETVTMDTPPAEYEDAVTLEQETVAQQPETALPLIIMLTAAGVLVAAGVVVFLLKRKK